MKIIDLLNEVVTLGYDRAYALTNICARLGSELDERKPHMDEEISESLYNDIIGGFIEEKEMNIGM